jgi:TonB family protein
MRKDYIYSVATHVFVILIVTFQGEIFKNREFSYYRKVYNVGLVTVEKPKPKTFAVPSRTAPASVPKAEVPKKTAKRPLKKKPEPVQAEVDTSAIEEPKEDKKFTAAGGSIKLDVEQFEFMWYLNIIQTKIQNNWKPPVVSNASEALTVIYFKIKRNGEIVDINIEKDSGNFLLDQSALRAVSDSKRFPPLPKGFDKSILGVHFEFQYLQ